MISPGEACLVTGCAGNVGSNLVKTLLRHGLRVVGVDNFFSGMPENMHDFMGHSNFTFVDSSITNRKTMERLFLKQGPFASVVHLAAIVSVPYSMEHPRDTLAINHESSLFLHALAKGSGCKSFVFAGSAAEYGRVLDRPAREQDAGDPLSPYGESKFLTSKAIEASGYGCSVRFFNIYGPTRSKPGPYDGVVRLFMNRALQDQPLTVLGDGMQVRDFLFLGDAIKSLLMAMGLQSRNPLTGVFNVGTGQATTIVRLAQCVMERTKTDSIITFADERPGDIRFSLADPSKLKTTCGWSPDVTLAEGLTRTLEGMKFHTCQTAA